MNVLDRKPLAAKNKTMTTFTIDAENNITAYPNATECNPDLPPFDSQVALAKLSADWPMRRFVRDLEQHSWQHRSQQARGPEEGGGANLESDPATCGQCAA